MFQKFRSRFSRGSVTVSQRTAGCSERGSVSSFPLKNVAVSFGSFSPASLSKEFLCKYWYSAGLAWQAKQCSRREAEDQREQEVRGIVMGSV